MTRFGFWMTLFGSLYHGVTHFWGSVPRTVILEDRRQYPSVVISLEMGESHPQLSFPLQRESHSDSDPRVKPEDDAVCGPEDDVFGGSGSSSFPNCRRLPGRCYYES